MSVSGKHAYRFGFLKSEQWQDIRIACFVAIGTECHICHVDSLSNDVHHVVYPKDLSRTKPHHVRVMCRRCHAMIHEEMTQLPYTPGMSFNRKWKLFFAACFRVRKKLGIPVDKSGKPVVLIELKES